MQFMMTSNCGYSIRTHNEHNYYLYHSERTFGKLLNAQGEMGYNSV